MTLIATHRLRMFPEEKLHYDEKADDAQCGNRSPQAAWERQTELRELQSELESDFWGVGKAEVSKARKCVSCVCVRAIN